MTAHTPRVFISYSHDSPAHSQRVLAFALALRGDGIDVELDQFHSDEIVDWPRWCNEEMSRDRSDFVLCVCSAEYNRRIEGKVPPEKGKGVYWEGSLLDDELYDGKGNFRIVPVLFDDEPESSIPRFLRGWTFCRLRGFTLTDSGYKNLLRILTGQARVVKNPLGTIPVLPPEAIPTSMPTTGPQIAPTRLRHGADRLFGREKELAALDQAWEDPGQHVVTIVAWGGVGKTSLMVEWMGRKSAAGWPGFERVFDWSFYSQGTREQGAASADSFIAAALASFGDEAMAKSPVSPWDKGARLAQLVRERRTLLVLDGMEPLQYPPGPLGGKLKDPALEALLRGLAQQNPGLCVVTTREHVTDLEPFQGTTAPKWDLEYLSEEAGARLLHRAGANRAGAVGIGPDDGELRGASREVGGHALTLRLLGTYLAKAHHGDIRKRDRVKFEKADAKTQGGHAFKMMRAYEKWLSEEPTADGSVRAAPASRRRKALVDKPPVAPMGAARLAVLRLLGLFDRPADGGCIAALRRKPAIAGLTEPLVDLEEEDWNVTLSWLGDCGLISLHSEGESEGAFSEPGASARGLRVTEEEPLLYSRGTDLAMLFANRQSAIDAHPLIREYFARQLQEKNVDGWRAAHRRLYEHLTESTKDKPEPTLEDLQPLYQAVAHGCQAGLQQKACDEVYHDRIQRGNEFYSGRKLGAFGADVGAVACFFEQTWSRVSPAISEADQAWLLAVAAFDLRALGRLTEALEPMRAGLPIELKRKDWKNAAIRASNLSELELTLGKVPDAIRDGEQSVTFAERSGEWGMGLIVLTTLADALHQAGRRDEALAQFREAEKTQAERQPQYPLLYSQQGFQYCDLLLAEAERAAWQTVPNPQSAIRNPQCEGSCREVEQRAAQALMWAEAAPEASLLDIALDHLTWGRTALYRALVTDSKTEQAEALQTARKEVAAAVDGLRRAGRQDFIPRGLLSRAWLRVIEGDADGAQDDLDEAWEIAERGSMRLFMADVHLCRARLFHRVTPYPWNTPDSPLEKSPDGHEIHVLSRQDPAEGGRATLFEQPAKVKSAKDDLAAARKLIDESGYHRRDEELVDAEAVIGR